MASGRPQVRRGACLPGAIPEDWERIRSLAEEIELAPGRCLCVQAELALHAFLVISGLVKLFRSSSDSRGHVTGLLYPGDFLGFTKTSKVYDSSGQAVVATTAWRFRQPQFSDLLRTIPHLQQDLLDLAWRDLEAVRTHMLLLAHKSAEQRLAHFLVQHASRLNGKRGALHLLITRRDIAGYLGLDPATISRELGKLQRREIIDVPDRKRLLLLQPMVLRQLAAGFAPISQ